MSGKAMLLAGASALIAAAAPAPQATEPAQAAAETLTLTACAGCHSLDYIATQPPRRGLAFWQAEVTKMVRVFGAPIAADDAAAIAAHLAATR